VGQGKNNTDLLLGNSLCSAPSYLASAASAASNYTSNGFNDWYLPSFEELVQAKLNLATSVAEAALLGINVSDSQKYVGDYDYLASSEYSENSSAWVDFGIYTQSQSSLFNCGANWDNPPVSGWPRCSDYKPGTHFVRAVRSAYFVGGTGPGGGIIFYYDSVGFNCGVGFISTGSPTGGLCHYLEVAPDGWKGSGGDLPAVWAYSPNKDISVSGITDEGSPNNSSTGIGLGYKNSNLIVAQGNDNTTAAGAARAYAGGSLSDWYLPTTAELTLLCQWNRGVPQDVTTVCTGGSLNSPTYGASMAGFGSFYYWSSSEESAGWAWCQNFGDGTQLQGFKDYSSNYVRPVRAF
jgi:hypothetical protein